MKRKAMIFVLTTAVAAMAATAAMIPLVNNKMIQKIMC